MKKKRTYKTTDVESVDLTALLTMLTVGCIVAVDVAKTKMVAAIASATGEVLQLIRFEHPTQTAFFLRLLVALREAQFKPRVAMESTGTYGDALRHQCHTHGVAVAMIAPKLTHDFAEIIDGVPSMHDAKAATVLARLCALGKGKAWQPDSERRRCMRAWLDQRSPLSDTLALYFGHLEATLARHWPEFDKQLDVRKRCSPIALLQRYAGPQAVAHASAEVAEWLRTVSRKQYSPELIEGLIDSARKTLGVPMNEAEEAKLRLIARQIAHTQSLLDEVDTKLKEWVLQDEETSAIAKLVGPACAAAIASRVGSLREFASARAVEKALGLNLKERSSGETKGALKITKRGPSQVRQLLYLATLRVLNKNLIARAWYHQRSSYRANEKGKHKAVVAVMRKLARALFHVAKGEAFDANKLFDVRRLDLTESSNDNREKKTSSTSTSTSCARTRQNKSATRRSQGGFSQPQT